MNSALQPAIGRHLCANEGAREKRDCGLQNSKLALTNLYYDTDPPPRILVVDDEPDTRQLLSEVLIDSGCRVDTAADGEAAWQVLHATRHDPDCYHLLIIDNNMPKLSGIELIRRLRSARMALPVILALGTTPINTDWLRLAVILQKAGPLDQSGVNLILKLCLAPCTPLARPASEAAPRIIEELQVTAVLPKPFSLDQLVQTVREVLHTVNLVSLTHENLIGLS